MRLQPSRDGVREVGERKVCEVEMQLGADLRQVGSEILITPVDRRAARDATFIGFGA